MLLLVLKNKNGIGGSTSHALFKFPYKIYESEPAIGKALTELQANFNGVDTVIIDEY